jgi:tRNA(fMet)-specific endonuclease VapC
MIVLDTDIVTHISFGNAKLLRRLEAARREGVAVAIITWYEILRGRVENLLKAASEDELRVAVERFRHSEELLAEFEIVGVDDRSIRYFGRLRTLKHLRKIGRGDMPIACIALANNALLVTRNT